MDNVRRTVIIFVIGAFCAAFLLNSSFIRDIFVVPLIKDRCYVYQNTIYGQSFRYKILDRLSKNFYRVEYHLEPANYIYVLDKKILNPEDYEEIDCQLYELEAM